MRWTCFFTRRVDPILTPVTIDPSHPFPHVINKALCVAFQLRRHSKPAHNLPRRGHGAAKDSAPGPGSEQTGQHRLHLPARPDRDSHPQSLQGLPRDLLGRISCHPQQQSLSARGRVPQSARPGGHPIAQPAQGRRGSTGDRGRCRAGNRRSAHPAIRAASRGRCSRHRDR